MDHKLRFSPSPVADRRSELFSDRTHPFPARTRIETFGDALRLAAGKPVADPARGQPTEAPDGRQHPTSPDPAAVQAPAEPMLALGSLPGIAPATPALPPPSPIAPTQEEPSLAGPGPVQPARGARLLGTRAEYQLDPGAGKGTSYRGVAVRYWNVYSDGTKLMIEDWSSWTGTVDTSLANTDLVGGNVVGLVFGPPAPVNA